MNSKAKTTVVILIVLILISLALAGGGFYLFQQERTKNIQLQDQLTELNTRQKAIEKKFEESKKLISDLQLKLQDSKTKVDTLSRDLENEKTAREEAKAQLEQLKADLEEQKGLRQDIEKKLTQAQEDVTKTQVKLKELESEKTELESKIKDLETKSGDVELGKIVVSPEPVAAKVEEKKAEVKVKEKAKARVVQPTSEKKRETVEKALGLEGKVLVVNKDYNFAVINLGSKDGIGIGDVFSIYHNKKYAGDIKVEKVHDSMSAAGFVTEDIKDKVSEGDQVVQKVK